MATTSVHAAIIRTRWGGGPPDVYAEIIDGDGAPVCVHVYAESWETVFPDGSFGGEPVMHAELLAEPWIWWFHEYGPITRKGWLPDNRAKFDALRATR